MRYPIRNIISERVWYLIGDGDTRHIGFKVEMPGVYEIASVSNFSINDILCN